MKGLREFEIAFVGLKIGLHRFEYDIDRKFFGFFKDSPIQDCRVKVKLELEKKETFFILNFFIDGTVHTECDLCLEPFEKQIFGDFTCYVKFSENAPSLKDEDEVLFIAPDETILDVSHLVYEYIVLCLPIQKRGCEKPGEEPQCNKEVLKYIANEKIAQQNKKEDKEVDPRWAALKKLKK